MLENALPIKEGASYTIGHAARGVPPWARRDGRGQRKSMLRSHLRKEQARLKHNKHCDALIREAAVIQPLALSTQWAPR
jgi:hypothetical protein